MQAVKRIAYSVGLNGAAAGAGLLGTALIISHYGLAVFGNYVVDLSKLALIMLGLELLPSSYAQFRIQDDPEFARSTPAFFLLFGFVAVGACAAMIVVGAMSTASWFMLLHVFTYSLQRCFDTQILARGAVSLSVSMPLISNVVRAVVLIALMLFPVLPVNDALWASLASGSLATQITLAARQPAYYRILIDNAPLRSLRYLATLRREYSGYYLNSVLKRARDTLFPLFCDAVLPTKTELGKVLVFTRTNETISGQVRVLESFFIHRQTRADLAKARRSILLGSALLGHAAVIVVSTALLWNQGLTTSTILYAAAIGLSMYPYVYELAKRSDAYARNAPHEVTFSILAFLGTLLGTLGLAWTFDALIPPVLIGCIVLGQTMSALVYFARDRIGRTRAAT